MSDLQDRIARQIRAEVRYLRGYQCMNLERFRYYESEFHAAHERSDFRKLHEVVQDTVTISNDTIRLIRKRIALSDRRTFLLTNSAVEAREDTHTSPPRCITKCNDIHQAEQ
ncbi:MAG TPA: hypothetical protein VIG44_04050 [Thermomicrobiales bacterium]